MNKTDEAAIEQARSQFGEPLAPPDEGLSDQKRIQFLQAAVAVDLSRIEQLEKALKDLAFAARTSGGIAGRDAALCAVCDYAEGVLNGDERLYGAAPETCDVQQLRDARYCIGVLLQVAGGRVIIKPSDMLNFDSRKEIVTFDDPVTGSRIMELSQPASAKAETSDDSAALTQIAATLRAIAGRDEKRGLSTTGLENAAREIEWSARRDRPAPKAFIQLCVPHGKDWLTCPECAKAAGIGGEQA